MIYKKKKYDITEEDVRAGKYSWWELIEPLWWSVSIYDGLSRYESDLEPFTDAQRAAFAVAWYDSEVCNGGHDQLLFNSTGIVWRDALAGFRLFGAHECTAVLESVIEKCGGDIPFDRAERQEMLDRITSDPENKEGFIDLFRGEDSRYFKVNDGLEQLIAEYAAAHAGDFVFCGEADVPADP